jgi:hypothetical protein
MEGRPRAAEPVSLRGVALPAEHGGWGLLAEPLVLGLALAPSLAGAGIAAACLGAFLLHHPSKLVLADLRRGARYPRTGLAIRVAIAYAAVAGGGIVLAAAFARGPFWAPLALAAPLAALQLAYDARNASRQLTPELVGALALAAGAPAILLASAWTPLAAAVVWGLLGARAVGSIIYIRARLRRDRGLGASVAPPLAASTLAVLAAAGLASTGHAPWAAAAAFAILLARAGWGLSPWHSVVRPRTVGFQELAYGAATTGLFAFGFLR